MVCNQRRLQQRTEISSRFFTLRPKFVPDGPSLITITRLATDHAVVGFEFFGANLAPFGLFQSGSLECSRHAVSLSLLTKPFGRARTDLPTVCYIIIV